MLQSALYLNPTEANQGGLSKHNTGLKKKKEAIFVLNQTNNKKSG